MLIVIEKDATPEEIANQLKKLKESEKPKRTKADFFGTMKGVYGDPIKYQRAIRDEWE